ncbi:MAG: KTSC domain-containing protein [Acidobacteriaceae bacterium]
MESTTVRSLGYDTARRVLEIEFQDSGEIYRYFDVPEWEHAAFLAAESKGTYLNKAFKERGYRYERVR